MFKKTIKYTDFNGNEREEEYYFNLTKAEIAEKQMSRDGGLDEWIRKIANEKDIPKLADLFKKIILGAYGEKSEDGKSFIKKDINGVPLSEKFYASAAYDVLYMELFTDVDTFIAFIIACLPSDMQEEIRLKMKAEAEKTKVMNAQN